MPARESGCILFSCSHAESHSTKANVKLLLRRLKTLYKPEKLDVAEINIDSIAHAQVGECWSLFPAWLIASHGAFDLDNRLWCLDAQPKTSAAVRRLPCSRLCAREGHCCFSLANVCAGSL